MSSFINKILGIAPTAEKEGRGFTGRSVGRSGDRDSHKNTMNTSTVSFLLAVLVCTAACPSDDTSGDTEPSTTEAPTTDPSTTSVASASGSTTDDGTTSTASVDTGSSSGSSSREASSSSSGGEAQAAIVSAYHGLDVLPMNAIALCGPPGVGQDGMPVAFAFRLDGETVLPAYFNVRAPDGTDVTPTCATLAPANEPLELHTVLLAGPFSMNGEVPLLVEVTGPVETVDGESLEGAFTDEVTPLADGPELFLAERYPPAQEGLAGECPKGTLQVVQMAWQGGVTGPDGAALGEAQRLAVHVTLENAEVVEPIGLADDDPDNYVLACLDQASPAVLLEVDAGFFHDPGDDPNPATGIDVVEGSP